MAMEDYILELKNITKTFPGVKALDKVSFNLKKGEIHALMGENGAGKSTFIKIITGLYLPDDGEIFFYGKKVCFTGTRESTDLGISATYQRSTVFPDLAVYENIFMGHEKLGNIKMLNRSFMKEKAQELLDSIGAGFNANEKVANLSVAQQQMVEIAKALSLETKVLILDEPTASLTIKESEKLYEICKALKQKGTSIILISHKFADIYSIADRITVLRDGEYIGTWNTTDIDENRLIEAMVGRQLAQQFPKKDTEPGEVIFEVRGLTKDGVFENINFKLKKGEILGITGLIGAGRTELAESIFGISKPDSGTIFINGKERKIRHSSDAFRNKLGYLSEDRCKTGLILNMSISDNIIMNVLKQYSKSLFFLKRKANEKAEELAKALRVKATSVYDIPESLSGGNQQKVCVAKLLALDLDVLIIDEPTKGIDVGAKAAIYEIMCDLAKKGMGIIMISSEMEETLMMSDRIIVMREGRITGEFNKADATQVKILNAAMVG